MRGKGNVCIAMLHLSRVHLSQLDDQVRHDQNGRIITNAGLL